MAEHYTVTTWRVKEGQEDAFVRAFRAFTEAATAHGGAREGMILQDTDEPNRFVVVRRWDGRSDIERWGTERDPALVDAIWATLDGDEQEAFVTTKVLDIG